MKREETRENLKQNRDDSEYISENRKETQKLMIAEPEAAYHAEYKEEKKQGEYTVKDYYAIPDEKRVELIDGVIYDMAAPTFIHRMFCSEITFRLQYFVREKGGKCIILSSPVDVQLDCNDKTMVQPDIMIVCDRDKILKKVLFGAPDFVAEILSKSTRKKDMGLKLQKYINAGVREYWMVDPDRQKVVVYDLEHEELPVIYGFEEKVPVQIFDGECVIDFAEIYEYMKFLYERE